jgi:uncharacterized protein (TIGR04255 family)
MLESTPDSAAAHRHYTRAPITEALIDIQLTAPPSVKVEDLRLMPKEIRADYPRAAPSLEFKGQFSAGEQVGAAAMQNAIGVIFYSQNQKQVAQFRLNGFTFSRLAPYENWGQLRDEARRPWGVYRPVAGPAVITRLALRYINQINIPLPMRDVRDYLRTYPEVSTDLPQGLAGFFMQTRIPQVDIGGQLVLTQAMVGPPDEHTCSVALDIDVFVQDVGLQSDEEIWRLLEVLRGRKNAVFEACITNETRRMII